MTKNGKVLFAVVLLISGTIPSSGQNNRSWEVRLTGSLNRPLDDDVDIEVSDRNGSYNCTTFEVPKGVLCRARLSPGATSASVKIAAKGYKKYELNIPRIDFFGGAATIPLGKIDLVPSESPQVRQIVESRGVNGLRRFEITLNNSLPKDVFIKHVRIQAHREGDGSECCCPPTAVFEIGQNIVITAGGEKKESAQGSYIESVRGKDYSITTRGEISNFLCNGELNLDLGMQTSFLIPRSSFSAIQFVFPRNLSIRRSEWDCIYWFSGCDASPKSRPAIRKKDSDIGRFTYFQFSLTPDDEKELDISAEIGTKPKGF